MSFGKKAIFEVIVHLCTGGNMTILTKTFHVEQQHTARHLGSGNLDVLATPALVAFMENVAFEYAQQQLNSEQTTVGSAISIEHIAPTKIGQTVQVNVIDVKQEGKVFQFKLSAYENDKLIGTCTHTRVTITVDKFLQRLI